MIKDGEEAKDLLDHLEFMTKIREDSPFRPGYISKMTNQEKKEFLYEVRLPKKRLKKIAILEDDIGEEKIKLKGDIVEEKMRLEGDIGEEKMKLESNNVREQIKLE